MYIIYYVLEYTIKYQFQKLVALWFGNNQKHIYEQVKINHQILIYLLNLNQKYFKGIVH